MAFGDGNLRAGNSLVPSALTLSPFPSNTGLPKLVLASLENPSSCQFPAFLPSLPRSQGKPGSLLPSPFSSQLLGSLLFGPLPFPVGASSASLGCGGRQRGGVPPSWQK